MAVISIGAFGRPRGKIGNVVFGAARSRTGKIVTARSLVIPANPNSAGQQTQRSKFSDSVFLMRQWGASVWQSNWNRAIGQLPGFQSGMSILLDSMSSAGLLTTPPDTPLGPLHVPDTLTVTDTGNGNGFTVTWSNEVGPDGTAADILKVVWTPTARVDRVALNIGNELSGESRASSPSEITVGTIAIQYLVGIWFQGAGTATGLDSIINWFLVTPTT
jgi:hypothetical protein